MTIRKTPALLIEDLQEVRAVLETLPKNAKAIRQSEVHIDDIGFVELERKPVRDLKQFALPVGSAVLVLVLSLVLGSANSAPIEPNVTVSGSSCIADSTKAEFDSWLARSLASDSATENQVLDISTDLGKLELSIDSTIGSAAKVSGIVMCDDGRSLVINHRVDTSGAGTVLELGQ